MAMYRATTTAIFPSEEGKPEITIYQGTAYSDTDPILSALMKEHSWAFQADETATSKK